MFRYVRLLELWFLTFQIHKILKIDTQRSLWFGRAQDSKSMDLRSSPAQSKVFNIRVNNLFRVGIYYIVTSHALVTNTHAKTFCINI